MSLLDEEKFDSPALLAKLILERIEGETAVCEAEDGSQLNLDVALLPKDVSEGDVLVLKGGRYEIDPLQTNTLRDKNHELFTSIFKEQE